MSGNRRAVFPVGPLQPDPDEIRASSPGTEDSHTPRADEREAVARWLYDNWGAAIEWDELPRGITDLWRDRAAELLDLLAARSSGVTADGDGA